MRRIVFILCAVALSVACSSEEKGPSGVLKLEEPSDVCIERTGTVSVRMTWKDNSSEEAGFAVYFASGANGTRDRIAMLGPDVTEFSMSEGLEEGVGYWLGVQALGKSQESDSGIAGKEFMLEKPEEKTPVPVIESAEGNGACLCVRYRIDNYEEGCEYGLCWNTEGSPVAADACMPGPETADGASMLQVIPNAALEYGMTYHVRAYARHGREVSYSEEYEVSLDGTGLEAISLEWKRLDFGELPAGVEIYETDDPVGGDRFHAWYAKADLTSGDVELRVMVPGTAATIDAQAEAAGDCLVLVNGGYFYNGAHTGLAVMEGIARGMIQPVRGSLRTGDAEYDVMYNITRGIFGVDGNGVPGVYWAGTDASSAPRYYTSPLPSVKGEAKYGPANDCNFAWSAAWQPEYALSAGPVLLYDGKCPFDFMLTDSGPDYYLSNYEIIPYDIFGPDVTPDRTAAGYTGDGHVILFVCDGRIASSGGATLTELAAIMKGIGCVGAVNLDGGGSTGMVVCGRHLNDQTGGNRAVVSSVGFFRK